MEQETKRGKRFLTKGEAAVLLAVLAALLLWLLLPRSAGGQVVVTVGGQELGRWLLVEDRTLPVQGAGGFSLTLVIQDGAAWVEGSTCPDLICQHHSPIQNRGESIVCLPGQVVITVAGGSGEEVDAIAG